MSEDELLPLDSTCPFCGVHSDCSEIYDGCEWDFRNCGKTLVAVAWANGTMTLCKPDPRTPADGRTGRERTRARWRRTGRR